MPDSLERRLRGRLTDLEAAGLRRVLRPPAGIDFSSNDYLCLSTHPLLKQRMAEAVDREGCGSTGSRLLRGDRNCFAQVERRFAEFKGTERALYFSSGYLANLAVLTGLTDAGDVIFSDERNHASLIDGMRLARARRVIFPHNDAAELGRRLREEGGPGQKFVVTESLFSMDGDFAPLAAYAEVCQAHGAVLIVDEAHGVGVYGERGSGLLEACGVEALVSINTAGKALGVCGAFVAGPEWAIEYLVQQARPFLFSTAAPPPVAAALEASLTLMDAEPWRRRQLLERARYLRARLQESGVVAGEGASQIISVVLGANERALLVSETLQHAGFDARAIRPPSVAPGTARLRLSVNAGLAETTLDHFAAVLAGAIEESALCSAASS